MKKILFFALFALFSAAAFAQRVEITLVADSSFTLTTSFSGASGGTTSTQTKTGLDSAKVKAEILQLAQGLSNQLAEKKLEVMTIERDLTQVAARFRTFSNVTVEDAIKPALEAQWIGDYIFTQSGTKKTLKITKPPSATSRLRARIDAATTGTLKIESLNSAIVLNSFTNAAGTSIDVQLLRGDGGEIFAEIDGVRIRFRKKA